MKLAAFVCFVGLGGDSCWPHACRKGDGTAGTVGFVGIITGRGRDAPFTLDVDAPLAVTAGEPLDTGNGNVVSGAFRWAEEGTAEELGWSSEAFGSAVVVWNVGISGVWATRRRLLSSFGCSGVVGSLSLEGVERDVPKAGD